MTSAQRSTIYLILLFFAFTISMLKIRRATPPMKIIALILGLTLCSESIAWWAALKWHNNMFVFHFYAPLLLIATAVYYERAVPLFRKYKLTLWILPLAIGASFANSFFLQPLTIFNTNFVLFEGLCIVFMALCTFIVLLQHPHVNFARRSCFWISFVFLFFWCSTYMGWALLNILTMMKYEKLNGVYTGLWLINLLTYSALGLICWLENKNHLLS